MRPVVVEFDASAPVEVQAAAHHAAKVLRGMLPGVQVQVRSVQVQTRVVSSAVGLECTAGEGRVVRHG